MFGQHEDTNMNTGAASAPIVPMPAQDQQVAPPQTPATLAYADPKDPFAGSMLDAATAQQQPMSAPAMPNSQMPTMNAPVAPMPASDPASGDDLLGMKQEALKHLQPLVGNLQQSPDEEFKTLMMMIQATDDRTMLKKALETAKRIPEDKARAQAMLDVINEINYFTQGGPEV